MKFSSLPLVIQIQVLILVNIFVLLMNHKIVFKALSYYYYKGSGVNIKIIWVY